MIAEQYAQSNSEMNLEQQQKLFDDPCIHRPSWISKWLLQSYVLSHKLIVMKSSF